MNKIISTFILTLICFVNFGTTANAQETKTLPDFSFYNLEGTTVKAADIAYDDYLTIVYFDPTCDHCIEQVEDIIAEWDKFTKTVMVFISFSEAESIKEFQDKYFPKQPKNVVFLHDKDMKLFDYFNDFYDTPSFKIFDKTGKAIAHTEQVPAADLYKHYK